jgi:hypothetical protein
MARAGAQQPQPVNDSIPPAMKETTAPSWIDGLSITRDLHSNLSEQQSVDDSTLPIRKQTTATSWTAGLSLTHDQYSIPLDQAAILNKDYSWLPSPPGESFPHPNIPISVLTSLNELAELEASKEAEDQELETADEGKYSPISIPFRAKPAAVSDVQGHTMEVDIDDGRPEHASDSDPGSEGSIPWSQTPPRPLSHLHGGLPPDSSAVTPAKPAFRASLLNSSPKIAIQDSPAMRTGSAAKFKIRGSSRPLTHSHAGSAPDSSLPRRFGSSSGPTIRGIAQADSIDLSEDDSNGEQANGGTQMSDSGSQDLAMQPIPSSPPEPAHAARTTVTELEEAGDDSEDDMEFAIPQALDNLKMKEITNLSAQRRISSDVSKVQVGETPQFAGQRRIHRDLARPSPSWSPARQHSSGQTTSSTSVVPSTYVEPRGPLGPKAVSAKETPVQVDLTSDGDEMLVDEQLHAEVEAASRRPQSSSSQVWPVNQVNTQSASTRAPLLVPHAQSTTMGSLAKRKVSDPSISSNQSGSKRARPMGSDVPEMAKRKRDDALSPMTIREQRRMKLNSYNASDEASIEGSPLSSPKLGITRKASNGFGSTQRFVPLSSPLPQPHPPKPSAISIRGSLSTNTTKASEQVTRVFSKFCQAYPEYKGNRQHFIAMCTDINNLPKDRKLHKMLWDDYVGRREIEYATHKKNCYLRGEAPGSYYDFYAEIDDQCFDKRILNPETLKIVVDSAPTLPTSPTLNPPARRLPTSPVGSSAKRPRREFPPGWQPKSTEQQSGKSRSSLPGTAPLQQGSKLPPVSGFVSTSSPPRPADIADFQTQERRHRTTTDLQPGLQSSHPTPPPRAPEGDAAHLNPPSRALGVTQRESTTASTPVDVDAAAAGTSEPSPVRDSHSEFNDFVRRYATLASVGGRLGVPDEQGILHPTHKTEIDVLSWPIGFKR